MKTRLIFSMFVLMTACTVALATKTKFSNYAELKGNSLSEFGNYQIKKSSTPLVINKQEIKTYELSYDNASRDVTIGIIETKKCRNFIVKTDLFEIEYVCNKGVFGVKLMNPAYATIDWAHNENYLDRVQYFSQKIISQTKKSEGELLGLIACYFPHLIKNDYLAQF